MAKKTIMAVGAHTGDAQLTCGLLLTRHAMQGDDVIIVDLTAGERGTPAGMTPQTFRPVNVEAARRFAERIGGRSIVLDTPDGELDYSVPAAIALGDIMREHHVDTVLYHWKNSIHRDHVAAHRLTEDAIFYASLATFVGGRRGLYAVLLLRRDRGLPAVEGGRARAVAERALDLVQVPALL